MLLALLAVPLAVGGYVLLERRRQRQAAAFANPALVPNLVGTQPRPAAPPPARAGAARARRARDRSRAPTRDGVGRTRGGDGGARDRHLPLDGREGRPAEPARGRAARGADASSTNLPEGYRVGMVSFAQSRVDRAAGDRRTGTRRSARSPQPAHRRRHGARRGDRPRGPGRTARPAVDGTRRPPASILVLSDGAQTQGVLEPLQAAQRAKRLKIPVYTVAFGTADGRGRGGRRQRLHPARDRAARPADAAPGLAGDRRPLLRGARRRALNAVYEELGSRLGQRQEGT